MPIHFTIDHKTRFVDAKFDGLIVLKDVEDFCDAIIGQNCLPYRKLIDGRTAVGKYDDKDVMAMGARMSAYATMGPRGALAMVPADTVSLELTDRLINLGKEGRPAKAFRSIDEARTWLLDQPEV